MHLVRVLLFTAFGTFAAEHYGTDQHYDQVPTGNATATKARYASNNKSLDNVFYVTQTRYVAVTHVVTVIEAASSSHSKVLPSYSFIEKDGKTDWLGGKTPPASRSYDIVTSYVTVQPSVDTVTITRPKSSLSVKTFGSAAHTGVGKDGWNSTSSVTFNSGSTQQNSATASPHATNLHATFSGTAYPEEHKEARARRLLYLRAADNVIIATIDGDVVSWTNSFNGLTARTVASVDQLPGLTTPESVVTPATSVFSTDHVTSSPAVVPIYPWDLNIPIASNTGSSSLISSTSSALSDLLSSSSSTFTMISPSPSITLAVYPWDLSFQPESSSTSTTLVTQALTSESISSISATIPNTPASSSPIPSITLAVYPWDLAFEPIALTSTTLATQVSIAKVVSSSSTISTVAANPVSCSSASPTYTVTYDDLPSFDITAAPEDLDIPPIRNPYRNLYWQNHFGYVPPPSDPFPPRSPPQLAVYRASNTSDEGESPSEGGQQPGELGAGPRSSDSAYWIDAHSVWFGCADGSSNPCGVTVNGYRGGAGVVTVTQKFSVPPCPGLKGCALHLVQFVSGMTSLSGLQILASVEGTPVDYYLDDLALSWSNNSCAAQYQRASSE